ncbi:MAG: CPBP family intramembrane metalloprotease [Methanospirillaceae archaeon]|nr:CPBP family intramembrane metalloprotease [Methanospirillaceae archaeon]
MDNSVKALQTRDGITDAQYSISKILVIWALATAPMVFFAYIVTPALIQYLAIPDSIPPFLVFWPLMTIALVWQFILSLIIIYTESGKLRWQDMKRRMWYTKPIDPKTGRHNCRLFLWVIPFILLSLVLQIIPLPDVIGILFPSLDSLPHYNLGQLGQTGFSGAWYLLVLTLVTIPFNYLLGEEFLFRGILLPKMNGVFGKWDWFINGVLFGLYHLHKPQGVLSQVIFSGLILSYPSKRFRSNWMAVIIHGIEAPIALFIVLGIILS